MARRKKTTVTLHHPKAGTYEAPPSAVEFWKSKGWKAAASGPKTTADKAAEKKES